MWMRSVSGMPRCSTALFVARGPVLGGQTTFSVSDPAAPPFGTIPCSSSMSGGGACLPAFHICVGANDQLLTADWYKEHGIELILGPKKTLLTSIGEVISYTTLIVATGAPALKLEEFGGSGSNAENVCYLRDIVDADKLVSVMRSFPGGNAIVIGGGYIGMECAAALVANKIKVTIVFPGKHCRVTFIKGIAVSSLEISSGKIASRMYINHLLAICSFSLEIEVSSSLFVLIK
uniref:FAD/NAD(P)-binding domain-containing protein n=1 Tax=Setaria italica TaxID=4555 RepID=K3YVF0_SETIT